MSFLRVAPHGTLAERSGVQPSLRGCDGERREHVRVMRRQDPRAKTGSGTFSRKKMSQTLLGALCAAKTDKSIAGLGR
jgi:hypothetical protein